MTEPTTDEQRWVARVKELERRAQLACWVLGGNAQAPTGRQVEGSPDTTPDEALGGYLDELEILCKAATPGPWVFNEFRDGLLGPDGCDVAQAWAWSGERSLEQRDANAAFIAAARDALPRLIAKVRELQAGRGRGGAQ